MDLIIDANVIISAIIATEGKTCDLIFNDRISLFAPEYLMEEFEEHKDEILKKSRLTNEDFEVFLSIISSRIQFIPYSEFSTYVSEVEQFTPDPDDTEYLALALKLKCSIWSNDKKLKNQDKITICSTSELIKLI
ncbi:MAG: PIN domain-containing protein [bacterium]